MHGSTDIYTLSAINLAHIDTIKKRLNECATLITSATKQYGQKVLRKALRVARSTCYKACMFSIYVDLYQLLNAFNQKLSYLESSDILIKLRTKLTQICDAITNAMVAHCAGKAIKEKAHGISIYLPEFYIDISYASTLFSQESLWLEVIKFATGTE